MVNATLKFLTHPLQNFLFAILQHPLSKFFPNLRSLILRTTVSIAYGMVAIKRTNDCFNRNFFSMNLCIRPNGYLASALEFCQKRPFCFYGNPCLFIIDV